MSDKQTIVVEKVLQKTSQSGKEMLSVLLSDDSWRTAMKFDRHGKQTLAYKVLLNGGPGEYIVELDDAFIRSAKSAKGMGVETPNGVPAFPPITAPSVGDSALAPKHAFPPQQGGSGEGLKIGNCLTNGVALAIGFLNQQTADRDDYLRIALYFARGLYAGTAGGLTAPVEDVIIEQPKQAQKEEVLPY